MGFKSLNQQYISIFISIYHMFKHKINLFQYIIQYLCLHIILCMFYPCRQVYINFELYSLKTIKTFIYSIFPFTINFINHQNARQSGTVCYCQENQRYIILFLPIHSLMFILIKSRISAN